MKLDRETLRKLPFALRVEIEENAVRKNLTQSELAKQQVRILAEIRKHSKPGTRTDLKTPSKPLPKVEPDRATDIVGKLYGESREQVKKRIAVVEAAEAEPKKFTKLQEDMDRTGRVNGPHQRLKVMRQAAAIRKEPPPYPGKGPYRVIVVDVPWPYEKRDEDPSHRGIRPYPPMSIKQMCAEADKVRSIAHEDCVLWFWTTNYYMRDAFEVLDAWGFEPKTILTWVKDRIGSGDWLRSITEHCIMATRGKPVVEIFKTDPASTVLYGKRREHSRKPAEFYPFVEKLCSAPRYACLFAREELGDKWDCHGDETTLFKRKK